MAELVDALASGASVLAGVEVRVFSWAPKVHCFALKIRMIAQVAELVDALASGASILTGVEVRVFSWAPYIKYKMFRFPPDFLLVCISWNNC